MAEIRVEPGDCLDVLPRLAAEGVRVDAIVTDPPYHLTSQVRRYSSPTAAPIQSNDATEVYARGARGFMGQIWDGGGVAFDPATWRAAGALLRPGGYLLAFGGDRTYDMLGAAIRAAGFEVRGAVLWLYGSGFPKSHDVAKGIDRRRDWSALKDLQAAIRSARKRLRISQSEAARRVGLIGPGESLGGGGFMWFETGLRLPTREQWPRVKAALRLGDEFDGAFAGIIRGAAGAPTRAGASFGQEYERTSKGPPVTDEARAWQGWGTALKPAVELICMARKPLAERSVAANVLEHGTGALNIDGCRIGTGGGEPRIGEASQGRRYGDSGSTSFTLLPGPRGGGLDGRWPANVVHDGSPEVLDAFAAFGEKRVGAGVFKRASGSDANGNKGSAYGAESRPAGTECPSYGDTGTAARFFYSAKADADDRFGSRHPTVKPVDLMRWLCRLVTPPGGLVLDPFAGSGTTGAACLAEGFDAVLIEREPEYLEDIAARLDHARGEGGHSAAVKARRRKPEETAADKLPLFKREGE